jgi:hypothetical protein
MEPTASKPSPFRAERKLSCSSFPVALLNKFGWQSCLNCANDRAEPRSLWKNDNKRCDPLPDGGSEDHATAMHHSTRRIRPPCMPMDSSFVAATPTERSCTLSEVSVATDTPTERYVALSNKENLPIGSIVEMVGRA